MLLPNKIKNKLSKIAKQYVLKRDIFKPCDFFINNTKQNINLYKIKNRKDLKYKLEALYELNEKYVYMLHITNHYFLNTLNGEIDIIAVNKNFQVVKLFCDFKKNKVITNKEIDYLYIAKKGFIAFHELNESDFVSTHPINIKNKTFL